MAHPLYDDEALVDKVTRHHLDAGRTVLQLWMLGKDEREHSLKVLDIVSPPHRARVLSLGCGVAGMEAYWHDVRPDMVFTLVNTSPSQLELVQCPGTRQCGDAQDYVKPYDAPRFDVAVLAYMLGHVDAQRVLQRAIDATRGTVVVLDVFDTGTEFARLMHYEAPKSWHMRSKGFHRYPVATEAWRMVNLTGEEAAPGMREAILDSQPAIWMRHG